MPGPQASSALWTSPSSAQRRFSATCFVNTKAGGAFAKAKGGGADTRDSLCTENHTLSRERTYFSGKRTLHLSLQPLRTFLCGVHLLNTDLQAQSRTFAFERMTDQGGPSRYNPLAGRGRRRAPARVPPSTQTGSAEAPSNNVSNSGSTANPGTLPRNSVQRWLKMINGMK